MSNMLTNPNKQEARDQAIQWARDAFNEPFFVTDLETTDLHNAAPVSIGACNWKGEAILTLLLNPERAISPGASGVHGIVAETVKDAPTFGSAYDQIAGVFAQFDERARYGYNYAFDFTILAEMCTLYDKPLFVDPDLPDRCVMHAYAAFAGEWNGKYRNYKYQKLTAAAAHFGLKWGDETAHDAAADACMTVRVMRAMARSRKSYEQPFYTALELAENPWWMNVGLTISHPKGKQEFDGCYHPKGKGKTIRVTQGALAQYAYPNKTFVLNLPETP